MSSVVQNILDSVIGDGARSTKFECYINFTSFDLYEKDEDIYALVKTSQFPGKSHEVMDIKFKGRTIPLKGQTKYDNTWTCTFYLTEDHKLKKAFEDWIESLDQKHNIKAVSNNVKQAQSNNNSLNGMGYTTQLNIAQMDFHGYQPMTFYTLYNAFPKSVSVVDVDYSAQGQVLEFSVEFSYSHFDTSNEQTQSGTFVDEIKSKAQDHINNTLDNVRNTITDVFR